MYCFVSAVRVLLLSMLAFAVTVPARAETFPSRTIQLVIPYEPGGIVDFAGRVLAQKLSTIVGQTVIPVNRPGAGGIVGVDSVAHSAPDGYSIVLIDPSVVINPTLHKTMPFDVFKDIVPISIVCSSPHVLVVTPQLGIKTFAELVTYGKANPDKLNFASAGVGTTPHLAGEMFMQRTGIKATHVPYKGVGPAFVDVMSGKVQMLFSSIAGALPFTSKGSIVPLATSGHKRSPVYPDLPTVEEEGLPGFVVDVWLGLYAPIGTPPDVFATLNSAVAKTLRDDGVKTSLAKFGIESRGTSLTEAATFTKDEYEKWKKVITENHITFD